jgi:hypothetical protein
MLVGVPLGYSFALKHDKVERAIFFLMVFFTAKMEDINFVSRETERLTSKGFEIGMVDICTMIIFLIVLHKKGTTGRIPKGAQWYFVYFGLSLLSIVNSDFVLFSMFELWKMIRMYFYFWTVYNYIDTDKKYFDFLKGVAAITIFVFYEVIKQKYLEGKFQTAGPFPHQNSLVMYMIIFGSIAFSYLINKKDLSIDKLVVWLMVFGMASVTIISTLSRAGLALYGFAIIIVLGLSFVNGINLKKMVITGLLIIMSLAVLAKAWDSITERFRTAPEESALVRVALAQAAVKMANDKKIGYLGVGLNNFGRAINPPYTYSSHIEMNDAEDEEEKNGLVETIYLMIAAESGWHTLLAFFVFLFYYYFLNLVNVFRYRGSNLQFLSIGLTGGLLAIYIESGLEWVLKQTNNFYELMLIFALIASMDRLYHIKVRRGEL